MTIATATSATGIPGEMECDPSYHRLKCHLIESTGLAYYADKDRELVPQIGRRMAALGISDCSEYLSLLLDNDDGEAEQDALAEGLTIGETFFFRHQELFDAIKDRVLPELIERNRNQRRLRIWSAGCATGAEAYSLAILLRREFAVQLADWEVTVVGTDINREFLAQGQRGVFTEWAFRSACDEVKNACFIMSGQTWSIREEYRGGVVFQYHNLVQHPFPSLINNLSAFDLILCRNVMIYFEPAIVRRLVGQFYGCLVDGGWFVVGPTEPSVELFRAYQTVNVPGAVLYRKAPKPSTSPGAALLGDAAPRAAEPGASQTSSGQSLANVAARLGKCKAEMAAPARRSPARRSAAPAPAPTLADAREKLNCGQCEEALLSCRGLLAADPLNPLVHYYHALAVEQQGHATETEAALRRAIYLDRDFVMAHYHLGLVLERKRDCQAAGRSFRNVLALLLRQDASQVFPDADGLTVGALQQLTTMQLEILNRT